MKLWMVLYVGQMIGATWGPLPYDAAECEKRKTEQNLFIKNAAKDEATLARLKAKGLDPSEISTWKFECVKRDWRPFTPSA